MCEEDDIVAGDLGNLRPSLRPGHLFIGLIVYPNETGFKRSAASITSAFNRHITSLRIQHSF